MLKIYTVTFNDGGWHSGGLPKFITVATSEDEAIKDVLKEHPSYATDNAWASELEIKGYVIEVFDKKTYNRVKNIKNLGI